MESKEINEVTTTREKITKLSESLLLYPTDYPIKFSYVIMRLFPSVWTNVQKALKDAYTNGYLQAKQEFEKN